MIVSFYNVGSAQGIHLSSLSRLVSHSHTSSFPGGTHILIESPSVYHGTQATTQTNQSSTKITNDHGTSNRSSTQSTRREGGGGLKPVIERHARGGRTNIIFSHHPVAVPAGSRA